MNTVGKFEKVSFYQFIYENGTLINSWINSYLHEERETEAYDNIILPKRSTKGSAGYDFYLPVNILIDPHSSITIGTGIKVKIDEGYVLMCFPRSSMGIKYGISMLNTVGIIDSDYYNNESNEGHILMALKNNSDEVFRAKAGTRFCQGIFVPFGITYDDDVETTRTGGVGSTGK